MVHNRMRQVLRESLVAKRALTEAAAAAAAAAAATATGAAYGARDMGSRCARANPVKKRPKMIISACFQ